MADLLIEPEQLSPAQREEAAQGERQRTLRVRLGVRHRQRRAPAEQKKKKNRERRALQAGSQTMKMTRTCCNSPLSFIFLLLSFLFLFSFFSSLFLFRFFFSFYCYFVPCSPAAAKDVPALDAEGGAQLLNVGHQRPRVVVLQASVPVSNRRLDREKKRILAEKKDG